MPKKNILLALLLYPVFICFGQKGNSTFIGYEFLILKEKSSLTASDDSYMEVQDLGIPSFLIRQEVLKSFSIETGILTRYIGKDFYLFSDKSLVCTHQNAIQVPLRVSHVLSLFNYRVQIYQSIGLNYNFIYDKLSREDLKIPSDIEVSGQFYKNTPGYDLGLGIDIFLHRNTSIGIIYRYMGSFNTVADINFRHIEDGAVQEWNIKNKGIAYGLSFRLQYRISTLWNR